MNEDKLPFQPPESGYVTEVHVLKVPITDQHLKNPWELRKYAEKLLEQKLGDAVQLTHLKVKKPNRVSKRIARFFNRVPQARLHITIKF